MTNIPTVTVIVGAYNHERYIAQALHSVIAQEAPFGIEIVVLEDASTDRTLEIVLDIQRDLDPGSSTTMTVFAPVINLNTNRTFRAALHRSRGEFVATLDGDDYWTSTDKLARQVELLRRRPELSMCIHAADHLDDATGEIVGRSATGSQDMTLCDLLPWNVIPACSAVIRRSAIADLPPYFDDAPYGDLLLYFDAALHGPIGVIDEVMGVYRVHSGGLWSGGDREERELRRVELFDNVRPEVRARCGAGLRHGKGDAYRAIATALIDEDRGARAMAYALRAAVVDPVGRVESVRLARHALPRVVGSTIHVASTTARRFSRSSPNPE